MRFASELGRVHWKTLATVSIVSLVILLCAPKRAASECVVVQAASRPTSQNIRVIAVHNGTSLQNVRIELYGNSSHAIQTLATNKKGFAEIHIEVPGGYQIVASTDAGVVGYAYIVVTKGKKASRVRLNLDPNRILTPSLQTLIARAESQISMKSRIFGGMVVDPAGAAIRGATVRVYAKDTGGKNVVAATETDYNGRFSADLHSGSYVVVFMSPGFATNIVPVDISTDASEDGLSIAMQIGPMC